MGLAPYDVMKIVFVYLVVAAGLVYLIFFAAQKNRISHFLKVTLPNRLHAESTRFLGPTVTHGISRVINYTFYERNPLVQIAYLIVVISAWSILVYHGYPMIDTPGGNPYIGTHNKYVGYFLYVTCLFTFYKSCTTDPGYITINNMNVYDNKEYDNVLYRPRQICRTKKMIKLPRSKYDKESNEHVSKFDHFCSWLNNPVGELNYKWFLTFLALHSFMLLYGTWAVGSLLLWDIDDQKLWKIKFVSRNGGRNQQSIPPSYTIILQYLAGTRMHLMGLFILASVMGVVVTLFFFFHLYICARGMTTNEYFKWGEIRKWHNYETEKYEKAVRRDDGSACVKFDVDEADYRFARGGGGKPVLGGGAREESLKAIEKEKEEKKGKGKEEESADDALLLTKMGDDANKDEEKEKDEESKEKEQLKSGIFPPPAMNIHKDPGPMPLNIYDKGVFLNFYDVFYPISGKAGAGAIEEENAMEAGRKKPKKKKFS